MAKNQENKSDLDLKSLNVKVVSHKFDMLEMEDYLKDRDSKVEHAQGTLAEYIKEKHYKGKNVVVVPRIDRIETASDLSGVDFTGCDLRDCIVQFTNLEGAKFNDADLTGVAFFDSNIKGADFRGADMHNVRFAAYGESMGANLAKSPKLEGIKLSTTKELMGQYLEENKEYKSEQEAEFDAARDLKVKAFDLQIKAIDGKINSAYSKLSYVQQGYALVGETGNDRYDSMVQRKAKVEMQKSRLSSTSLHSSKVRHIVSPSLLQVMNGDVELDPAYVRGSDKAARDQEKQYVKMDRADMEKYLDELSQNPELKLNDYAQQIMADKGVEYHDGAKAVADFSPRMVDGKMTNVNLSNLDFTGAKLQESCLTAANLTNATFDKANIDNTILESANLTGASFKETSARDTNMYHAQLEGATIDGSDFRRAYMRVSKANNLTVSNKSNFELANISDAKWDNAHISDSSFKGADLSGVSMAGADIRRTNMQQANLERAVLNGCKIIESDLTGAVMKDAMARKAEFKDSVLKDVDAREMNFTEAEIDELCKLDGASLQGAILDRVQADRVSFVGANMEGVQAHKASMKDALLENVNMRFSNLEGAMMEGVKAAGVDMTGAKVTDLQAKKADFKDATLKEIEGLTPDFEGAVMDGASLRGAKLQDALMEKVNLRKADLRNASLERAKLKDAKLQDALVNDATDLHGAEVSEVAESQMIKENLDGSREHVEVKEVVKECDLKHKEKKKNPVSKWLGDRSKNVSSGLSFIAKRFKQVMSSKTARIIMGVVGAAAAVSATVAFGVLTAGVGPAAVAGIIAGAALVGGGTGAVIGHYGAKQIGGTEAIALVAGTVATGLPIGGVAAAVAVKGVNVGLKKVVGADLNDAGAAVCNKGAEGFSKLGKEYGSNEQAQGLLDKAQAAKLQYEAEKSGVKPPSVAQEVNKVKAKEKEKAPQKSKEDILKDKAQAVVANVSRPKRAGSRATPPQPKGKGGGRGA